MCKALGSIPSTPKTYSNNPINPILKTIQNALTDKAVTYGLWTYFMLVCILDLAKYIVLVVFGIRHLTTA
jgi:hypothetical protein